MWEHPARWGLIFLFGPMVLNYYVFDGQLVERWPIAFILITLFGLFLLIGGSGGDGPAPRHIP